MKETRLQFIPPPLPKAELESLALWAKHMTVLLPAYLIRMQQVLLESAAQTYDVGVPVSPSDNLVHLESQTDETQSAGEIS